MSDEDAKYFRRAMSGVQPLPPAAPAPALPKPRAQARFTRAGRVLDEDARTASTRGLAAVDDHDVFRRPGVGNDVLRRLRRGEFPVEGEVDLHGLTRTAAQEALRAFIALAIGEGLHCVRVIHGKGRRSGIGGPVLKHSVGAWLARIDRVSAFAPARPVDGGSGALYVLLQHATPAPRTPPR